MGELARAIATFFSELSGRAWLGIFGLAILVGLAVVGFRGCTGAYTYDQVEREAELLSKLQELRRDPVMEQDTGLVRVYEGIREELHEAVEDDRGMSVPVSTLGPRVGQGLASFIPWVVVAIAFGRIPAFRQEDQSTAGIVAAVLTVGVLFATGGVLLPPDWSALIRYVVYPILGTFVVLAGFAIKGGG